MAAGCCCTPSSCWGFGSRAETEEELWQRKRREHLLESLSRVKGLSSCSRLLLEPDADYVIDGLEQKDNKDAEGTACGSNCEAVANSFCLLVWLGFYALVMVALQFRLYKLLEDWPFPQNWPDPGPMLRTIEQEVTVKFHAYYSAGIGAMMLVMTLSFASARSGIRGFVDRMTAHLVRLAQDELRTNIRDSVDQDFYAFVNRLPQYFCISEDFTKAAIRKVHRRLHTDLDMRTSLVDFDLKGPLSIRHEIHKRVANRMCCWSLWVFFFPWLITMMANAALVFRVYSITYAEQRTVEVRTPDLITEGQYWTALRDEGLQFIGYALLVNIASWAYLVAIQLKCATFYVMRLLYPRIHLAITAYCERLVSQLHAERCHKLTKTWIGAVLEGVADYITDVKPGVGFCEEEVKIPMTQRERTSHDAVQSFDHRRGVKDDAGSLNTQNDCQQPDQVWKQLPVQSKEDTAVQASPAYTALLSPRSI